MQYSIHRLIVTILFAALLPVSAWGYGFYDAPANSVTLPHAGAERSNRHSASLRLHTGETEDGYYVRTYIEGLRPEDIQVFIRRNRLVVQVEQGDRYGLSRPDNRRNSQWRMQFRKQLRLPYDADWTRMTTSTTNGTMEIYIPRRDLYMPANPLPMR
ncbi:MAG: Hsp20/alpha crystallin family protein [Gammaproteobacteria bacterium]